MAKPKQCPECGTELPAQAEAGLCPKCALAVGLESVADEDVLDDVTVDVVATNSVAVPAAGESLRYFGDYELVEEIARGGMGVVYKARQASLNRTVAVKMILAGQLAGQDEVQRFHAEAQAAANLQHPNIVAIHEVGEHEGQHYFSMDYVDGQSLAEVLRDHPVSATQAAAYVRTIAEAIAYAHEQGILHRDLKPSNVLVDQDGQLRITDFGLAKKIHDDAAMTATGQALGTPSYMPPEQAAGKKSEVGPASDVYSLGAILYELLTGRPPFRAETPLDTLMQVLDNDPAPPRILNPSLPKDIETICLKCLEKEADRRYSTASELADDLNRFLNDEPIYARPAGWAERGWRLLRKQRRSVALTAIAVITTLLLGTVGLVGWYSYHQWTLGYVQFLTDGPSITAEMMTESAELAVPTFTVPTIESIAVPSGDYRLRVSSDGRLSQNYRVNVRRGIEPEEYRLNLEDQLLWPTINVPRSFELLDIEGSADVILLDDGGIRRLRGLDGSTVVWELKLGKETSDSILDNQAHLRWPWDVSAIGGKPAFRPPHIVKPALDMDGDGVRDVVCAATHQAWLLTVSGKTGEVLWFAGRGSDLKGTETSKPTSTVVGIPTRIADLDSDGVPELVATFADFGKHTGSDDTPHRWIEAVSGASGKTLWTYELDNGWFDLLPGQEVPERNRSFVEVTAVNDERAWAFKYRGDVARFDQGFKRNGKWRYAPDPARAGEMDGQPVIIEIAGTRLVVLDPTTGMQIRPPIDLGFTPIQTPVVTDVDSDGSAEVVLVESVQKARWTTAAGKFRVVVWSLSDNKPLCEKVLSGYWPRMTGPTAESSGWPRVVDLNDDGQKELLVPNGTSIGRVSARTSPSSGSLEAVDGTTGEILWSRRLLSMDQQLNHFMEGEDIDGDGYRDVFAATLVGEDYELYVDALSGADGSKLWWSRRRLGKRDVWLGQLRWWQASSDGWPQLLVPVTHKDHDWTTSSLHAFSAGTGRLQRAGFGMEDVSFADANGDGLSDLFAFQPTHADDPHGGGKLNCIRAEPPESWRRIGSGWIVGEDYDRDGVDDLLHSIERTVSAFSGRDGTKLWERTLAGELERTPLPLALDVSADGTPDVLSADLRNGSFVGPSNLPLELLSGRDGRVLWSSNVKIRVSDGFLYVDCRQLDGQGSPELIIVAATDWDYPWRRSIGSPEKQHMLAVVAGHNGKVVWKRPLSMAYSSARNRRYHVRRGILRAAYADLSGDGVLDIVIPGEQLDNPDAFEMRAINGATGEVLWRYALAPGPSHAPWQAFEQLPVPTIGDLDGDGNPEVLMLEYDLSKGTAPSRIVRAIALDGAQGRVEWMWEMPVSEDCGRLSARPSKLDERPIPRLLRTESGNELVCINLWGNPGEIVVLNHAGKLVRRLAVENGEYAFRFWSHDLDSDGDDEILHTTNRSELLVIHPTNGEVIWQWLSPNREGAKIVDVWDSSRHTPWAATTTTAAPSEAEDAADSDQKTVVTVKSNYAMYGLSGRDGKILWTCEGPHPRAARGAVRAPSRMLLINKEGEMRNQRVLFQLPEDMAVCQQALAPDRTQTSIVSYRATPATSPAPGDPRLRVPVFSRSRYDKRAFATTIWGFAMSLFLIFVPVQYVRSLIIKRVWSLRTFLLLPAICAMIVLCLKADKPELVNEGFAVGPTRARINMAVFSLPLITFPLLLFSHVCAKRWRSIALWVLATLLLATVFSVVITLGDPRQLRPGERHTFEGWYFALFVGVMMAGWIALICSIVRQLIRTVKPVLLRRAPSALNAYHE